MSNLESALRALAREWATNADAIQCASQCLGDYPEFTSDHGKAAGLRQAARDLDTWCDEVFG